MRKYNPAMASVVDNFRRAAKERAGLDSSNLTNEQVFNMIEAAGVAPSSEEQVEWFIADLQQHMLDQ